MDGDGEMTRHLQQLGADSMEADLAFGRAGDSKSAWSSCRAVRQADKQTRVLSKNAVHLDFRASFCRLTFDMRGGRKWAKPACGRPLDGRVRRHAQVATNLGVRQPPLTWR